MDIKLKTNQGELSTSLFGHTEVNRILFSTLNRTTNSFEFYGSFAWNGTNWIIDMCHSDREHLEYNFNRTIYFMRKVLKNSDYDFFIPFYMNSPSTENVILTSAKLVPANQSNS